MRTRKASVILAAMIVTGLAPVGGPVSSAATAAPPGDWPTYRGNAARTGVSPGSGPSHDPTQLWRVQTQGAIASEPAVVGGIVYVGSDDGVLYALDAMTGAERWRYAADDTMSSSPAVADGTVFIGSGNGVLYALDAMTGAERWRFAGARAGTGPAVVDGVVYSGSDDGNLYAIDAATGTQIWEAPLGDSASRSPAVADGLVYIGSADAVIHAIDAATGTERWRFQTDGGVISTPVVADGVVYDCAFDGEADRMYALDAATGVERWRFATETGASVWPPIVNGPDLYTGGSDGNLYALDAATGTERWRFQTGGGVDSSPTLAGDIVYLVNEVGRMYAVDATTGGEVWRLAIDSGAEKGPSIAAGVAYAGTTFGSVYAIGSGTTEMPVSPQTSAGQTAGAGVGSPARIDLEDIPAEDPGAPLWESSGPTRGEPGMGSSAAVDPDGRIWVASSYDDAFWIFEPDGTYLESWGVSGSADGQLDLTRSDGTPFGDIAFEPDGTFYVADVGNHRIQKFDADRSFVSAWGSFGGGDAQFMSPSSVATDTAGIVYVGDDMRADVQEFGSDGTFIRVIGRGDGTSYALWHVEVDPLSRDIFVGQNDTIARYDADGELMARIDPPFEYPVHHAFDSAGRLYIAGDGGSVGGDGPDSVVVLDRAGALQRRIAVTGSQISVTPDGSTLLINYYDRDQIQAFGLGRVGGN